MTCKQLGGACDLKFHAETFEQMVEISKQHGMEMFQVHDNQHLEAMEKIKQMMADPEAMKAWYESKKGEFEQLSED
ncbi:DUF1059 domain-containing protein [Vibrio sp. ZSDE26]|uniref:DUF1059 domain-containing protein n=1 Tax=Vibrio amylolyticus TaxID=2847292 RepID=A0A9X1XGY4_9VIBR|nr:DUF1059 domain-containing protein [Vibrio amylolyticus]MCK6262947.1 DUF1059 domain-containing protein [Vibrio amylolyticus]